MAMKKCKECGGAVSDKAGACPHCGAPVKSQRKPIGCLSSIALIVFAVIVFSAALAPSGTSTSLNAPREKTQAEKDADAGWTAIAVAKRVMEQSLKDPDSAKFGPVFAVQTDDGQAVACGHVNAKNSFGGYSGEKGFILGSGIAVLEEEAGPSKWVASWNRICANRPVTASAR